jgi:phenylalanyl-tRNA synthetase beta chain
LDIAQPVYLLELALAGVLDGALPRFSELSRYPEVRRDLALVVDRDLPAETVLAVAREAAGSYLRNLTLFDVYQGKGIDPQRKSLGLGLTFQHSSRTLNEEEVNVIVEAVVDVLKARLAATLRN